MSTPTLRRPASTARPPSLPDPFPTPGPAEHRPVSSRPAVSDDLLSLGLALLVLAALLPMRRVFIGTEWVRPVIGSAVLALGIGWGSRRLRVGPVTHLAMSIIGLLVFVTIAFLPATAAAGLLPTLRTLDALRDLFLYGLELVTLRPSPTFAEAGLLLLAVAGVWIIAYLADGMMFVLRSPLAAITAALVLWCVPLAVAPGGESIVVPGLAMLGAAGLLLLLGNANATGTWGKAVVAGTSSARTGPVPPMGWAMLTAAAVCGVLLAGALPGFQERPVYNVRGGSGTTITTNPIVNIRDRLVATNTGPVLRVDTDRPVYMRTTALDTFNEREEWGIDGTIGGSNVRGPVADPPSIPTETVQVEVLVEGIETGAILAPTPYLTTEVAGSRASDMRYDADLATLTVPGDAPLVRGDRYRVTASLPQPDAEVLRAVQPDPASPHTELPANVPQLVNDLAQQIVTSAGATTMFDRALAIQDHLRTWSYSTQPQLGSGSTFIERFINGQQGYCEQFAGTMAVMLRTMGIPSRLAVGYTPGTQGADGSWEVTNANAHAWVEVDFGELGWVAFEPTPRTDGNVLVPDGESVVPTRTVAMAQAEGDGVPDPVGPGELPQSRQTEDPLTGEDPLVPLGSEAPAGNGSGSASGTDDGGVPWLLVLLALAGVGAVALVGARGRMTPDRPPEERIERARLRAERVGAAVGRARRTGETDAEYFVRLSDGHPSGTALAGPSTRADFAPAVTVADARTAESAAGTIRSRLMGRASRTARARLAIREALSR
ncbi:Transglutaminase [Euzebya pacifica]|uniref:Transglutaminase n=1 Tax=Euzebya pacifica TaxID=1608957 RepID=A0A346XYX7_9ACTN|nr:DUF3488 and transglutaminase-like domain-containing protein [Euzebya pacifica]AXV07424.1 Transglutaminase [Euzebya pacifica]